MLIYLNQHQSTTARSFTWALSFLACLVVNFHDKAPLQASESTIRFDLRPVAVAFPISTDAPNESDQTVKIEFAISSLVPTIGTSTFDQWTVRIVPRQNALYVTDYTPRSEVVSSLASNIDFKTTKERAYSVGVSAGSSYGSMLHGKAGIDHSGKNLETMQYQQHAPVQVVTAAGTIDHGRGVYFKLRSFAKQTLEGQKRFSVSFQVPDHWRADLVDVWVSAQRRTKPFPGFPVELQDLASQHFVVATHLAGDVEAEKLAWDLASAENDLRDATEEYYQNQQKRSLPSMLYHYVSIPYGKPRVRKPTNRAVWLNQLLADQTNPYDDRELSKLPADLRVIAINYCDRRSDFEKLSCY